ncbi:hypothetical protein VTK73DRAFT_3459 [Phialemonium thermophilum]|uniref:Uncharacterized protein n=1 Tax=Phialemonium thermophilum TaxID=223376 RepID=A0ABR3VI82_9PEZI
MMLEDKNRISLSSLKSPLHPTTESKHRRRQHPWVHRQWPQSGNSIFLSRGSRDLSQIQAYDTGQLSFSVERTILLREMFPLQRTTSYARSFS